MAFIFLYQISQVHQICGVLFLALIAILLSLLQQSESLESSELSSKSSVDPAEVNSFVFRFFVSISASTAFIRALASTVAAMALRGLDVDALTDDGEFGKEGRRGGASDWVSRIAASGIWLQRSMIAGRS